MIDRMGVIRPIGRAAEAANSGAVASVPGWASSAWRSVALAAMLKPADLVFTPMIAAVSPFQVGAVTFLT